nr:formin-like protein 3 [Aegilops tauschii subsp. strangulata]
MTASPVATTTSLKPLASSPPPRPEPRPSFRRRALDPVTPPHSSPATRTPPLPRPPLRARCPDPTNAGEAPGLFSPLVPVRARSPARRGLPPRRGHALAAPLPHRPRPTRAPAHRLPPRRAHRALPLLCLAPSPPACATAAPPTFGRRRPRPAAPCSPAARLGRGHASGVCSRALAGSSRPATRYARSAGPCTTDQWVLPPVSMTDGAHALGTQKI